MGYRTKDEIRERLKTLAAYLGATMWVLNRVSDTDKWGNDLTALEAEYWQMNDEWVELSARLSA